MHYKNFRAFRKILWKKFERFKCCDTAGKSSFILGTELWGSCYEDLLCIVKSYVIDKGKGKFDKVGGGSHAVLFMVPLGLPCARSMAQALRLPFE